MAQTVRTLAKQLRQSILAANGDIGDTNAPTLIQDENSRTIVVNGLDADEAMASTTSSVLLFRPHVAIRVLAARILPIGATGLTSNDTNYATVAIAKNDDAGGSKTTIASGATTATGGTGSWTGERSILLTNVATAVDVAAGQAIHLTTAKTASGVVVPKCRVQIRYEEV